MDSQQPPEPPRTRPLLTAVTAQSGVAKLVTSERRALPELLIFFITATGGCESAFGSAARFDLRRGDSVTEAVFAPCVYASAGSTSEGGVSEGGGLSQPGFTPVI